MPKHFEINIPTNRPNDQALAEMSPQQRRLAVFKSVLKDPICYMVWPEGAPTNAVANEMMLMLGGSTKSYKNWILGRLKAGDPTVQSFVMAADPGGARRYVWRTKAPEGPLPEPCITRVDNS